jgi:Ti-type conjugative transfer relaxase TraA
MIAMAIYHFSAKVISRANGSSALAAAAYRSASRLNDERLDRHHDFSNKAGVVHSEVLLPDGAPDAWRDREKLWNAVEAAELRKDAQLAREIEFAIPRELSPEMGIDLARDFVAREFVARGMIADLNVHWDVGADGEAKPHAHVMLTTRSVSADGFGAKVRDWNRTDLLEHWREAWADHVNQRLAELDIDASIDHRTLEAQGIELEPQHKIGPAASRMAGQGLASERLDEHHEIARANGDKLLANPAIALDAITHTQATFTTRDLAKFVHRHSEGKEQFDRVMAAAWASPELVTLGKDGRGEQRFTSRSMIETEQRLERATIALEARRHHGLPAAAGRVDLATAGSDRPRLGEEQRGALRHILRSGDLAIVTGYAGTGKSTMLGVARDEWERAGYCVRGAALSGIAAENLEAGSGIQSSTIASLEHRWARDRDPLTDSDVLVIDEAGMIGTRQMQRVLAEAEKRGAKVVLVGDPEQLQAIEAGAAFRSIAERYGSVEITQIRRQTEDWQRDATRWLATERTGEAIQAYAEHGFVHEADTRDAARSELIERWDRDRQARPAASRIILTHTNDEVAALNQAARKRLRSNGELGDEVAVNTERGERAFAPGDRVMFLRNERGLGVKNGSPGEVQSVTPSRMAVMLDDGRAVAFDIKDYAAIDHGYAATVHKAQGMTVDRVQVLATPGLDRHAAYVALSRHRNSVDIHYGRDDFADRDRLVRTLSRERSKDMASDYARGTEAPKRTIELAPAAPKRSMFDGLKLSGGQLTANVDDKRDLGSAVRRYLLAFAPVEMSETQGREPLPHQRTALEKARAELDAAQPSASRDLHVALARNPVLRDDAAKGQTAAVIRAMAIEAEIRTDPQMRADRFVEDWRRLTRYRRSVEDAGDSDGLRRVSRHMAGMAKSLERDPQLESLLRNRRIELGIRTPSGMSISHELQDSLGISRSRGIGR